VSCTLRDDALPRTSIPTLAGESAFNLFSPLQALHRGSFSEDRCSSLQTSIQTPLGKFAIAVHPIQEKKKTLLQIEEDTFEIFDAKPPAKVCKEDPEAYKYIATLLEKSVPGCHIGILKDSLSCAVPYHSAKDNLEILKGIKLSLVRQVKRVPYLLSRRLTLAENLAALLNTKRWEERLQSFCGVMNSSLPLERPIIVSSKLWRNALCTKDVSPHKYEVALIVLSKAVEEISFMHFLQDEANLAGNLSVHVQSALLPASKKVWVKLEAAPETIMDLMLASEKTRRIAALSSEHLPKKKRGHRRKPKDDEDELEKVTASEVKTPRACWFPGFSTKEHFFQPGRYIGLWGNHAEASCPQRETKTEIADVARYFMETISAETTFELSESNEKPLSLPAGPYLYTVYEIPDKLGEKLENHLVDQGTVIWNGSQQGLNVASKDIAAKNP